jgi:hypothetical protein
MEEDIVKFDDDGYNLKLLEEVKDLAYLGLTDEQIATAWNMTIGQFNELKRDERFRKALQEGKLFADGRVASAMYKRAIGYDYYEERAGFFKGEIVVARVKRHMPGDPWCMARWLEIRQRAMWSVKQQVEVTNTNININKIDFSGLTDDELLMIQKIQLKQLTKNAGGN